MLSGDDFGSRRTLASPLAGRQLPVVSAYTRAKDSFTAFRCHTRFLSQIRQSKHPAPQRDFLRHTASPPQESMFGEIKKPELALPTPATVIATQEN
jgi:hypothetical protein